MTLNIRGWKSENWEKTGDLTELGASPPAAQTYRKREDFDMSLMGSLTQLDWWMSIVAPVSIQSQECGQRWCKCRGSTHQSWQVTFFCLLPDVITSTSVGADASGRSSAEALTGTVWEWHFLANVVTRWCDSLITKQQLSETWKKKKCNFPASTASGPAGPASRLTGTPSWNVLALPFSGRGGVIHFSICPTTDTLQLRRPGLVEHKHGGSEATEAFRSP